MQVVAQNLDDILTGLQPLTVDWQDDISRRVIAEIEAMPVKKVYTLDDVRILLDKDFDDALLISRLFLGLSKDTFTGALRDALNGGAAGITNYRADKPKFLDALMRLGILEAMAEQTNRVPRWSDILVERLRSGRGSAISGQKRGRGVEDFAEAIVRKVFDDQFVARCTFTGRLAGSLGAGQPWKLGRTTRFFSSAQSPETTDFGGQRHLLAGLGLSGTVSNVG